MFVESEAKTIELTQRNALSIRLATCVIFFIQFLASYPCVLAQTRAPEPIERREIQSPTYRQRHTENGYRRQWCVPPPPKGWKILQNSVQFIELKVENRDLVKWDIMGNTGPTCFLVHTDGLPALFGYRNGSIEFKFRYLIERSEYLKPAYASDCSRLSETISQQDSDLDEDGISDACEQALAEKFAPIVVHSSDESNYPTSVDLFLQKTRLFFYNGTTRPLHNKVIDKPSQASLLGNKVGIAGPPPIQISSDGTWSVGKTTTFYLEDVAEEFRYGSTDSSEWTTYFHAYKNDLKGITIQYWRFYAYNDAFNNHGGDWEGIHVILAENLRPIKVALLGHVAVEYKSFADMQKEGEHILVYSEGGGHSSRSRGDRIVARNCGGGLISELNCTVNLNKPETFTRQETWTNGLVIWFDKKKGHTGRLLNVGEKVKPINGQLFLQYSGLWGSPSEAFGLPTYYAFSGYWGPAFNETGIRADKFITAWCDGMKNPLPGECFPTLSVP